MSVNLSPVFNDTQFKSDGTLAVGYKIYTYAEGSTTPLTTYTNSLGSVAQSNPIILNSRGEVSNPIWITAGVGYKFVLKTDADVTIKTVDNIRGVNDTSIAIDQWIPSSTPTFINASQFSVSGDQTSSYQINRRAKFNTSAGTVYGTISASVFSTLTTVTVALDNGVLDAGLSSVSLGLLTPNNPSIPTIPDSIFSISKLANAAIKAFFSLTNLTATRKFTFPDRNITVAGLDDVTNAVTNAVPAGVRIGFTGTSPPAGYLACPNMPTNLNRTTYAALFAAIGTTWGAGDGVNTFGMPWYPNDYASVSNGSVGTQTVGQVIAHTHTVGSYPGSGTYANSSGPGPTTTGQSGSTGGSANYAAGVRELFCVKY